MTTPIVYASAGAAMLCIALFAFLTARHVLRRILALNVIGSGVFMMLVALAARTDPPDPIPHALVLTGIVVAVCITALALALLRRMFANEGSAFLPEDRDLG
ncbi:MAG: NADH-quinone oxidoreductase subunit K [Hyphomicrobiaceae bacterium]